MNKKNYDDIMQNQISSLQSRPALLLHCCCAPCSSACLERLYEHFEITVFFYNPNIEDGEYEKRKAELKRFINETGYAKELDCEHDKWSFYGAASGLEHEREGGKRCEACFKLRLEKTALAAKANGFEYFATTLTLSPLKNAELINNIGESIAQEVGVKWLYSDFKKRGGYLQSVKLCEKHNLYRQRYCGCVFSQESVKI